MSDTLIFKGKITEGIKVASGQAKKCQKKFNEDGLVSHPGTYHGGTIKLQRRALKYDKITNKKNIELANYMDELDIYDGTINVKLDKYLILDPKKCDWVIKDLYWSFATVESFTIANAKIYVPKSDAFYDCLLYRPHYSKLSEHPRDICEILAPFIPGAFYGEDVEIHLDKEKVKDCGLKDKIKLSISGGDSPELDR
jgi:hypothetical protein